MVNSANALWQKLCLFSGKVLIFFIYLNRIRKEFLDAEAELSGSEGSDDEDERGLDKLLVEEGDLDDIDIDEVRYFLTFSADF